MNANHQDTAGDEATTVEDVTWVFNGKSKLWVPAHKKSG
jgi:hypothetical protein